ncbi:hypothetical protein [Salinicoccus sp. HZC-1]
MLKQRTGKPGYDPGKNDTGLTGMECSNTEDGPSGKTSGSEGIRYER